MSREVNKKLTKKGKLNINRILRGALTKEAVFDIVNLV